MSKKQIMTNVNNKAQFYNLLQLNKGLIIMKFGANWCKPCQKIKANVERFFEQAPSNIMCCDINVDDCEEVYDFLRNKRMITGIPTILCYKKGNVEYIPDDSFTGSNLNELDNFFRRCVIYSKSI